MRKLKILLVIAGMTMMSTSCTALGAAAVGTALDCLAYPYSYYCY